jgi:hypothetical protein
MTPLRKVLLLICCLALLSSAATKSAVARLTIVNKSGMPIAIQLEGANGDQTYYLPVLEGDAASPASKTFILLRDIYQAQIYYLELHDPVYGNQCGDASTTLNATQNARLVILKCTRQTALKNGEKSGARPSPRAQMTAR